MRNSGITRSGSSGWERPADEGVVRKTRVAYFDVGRKEIGGGEKNVEKTTEVMSWRVDVGGQAVRREKIVEGTSVRIIWSFQMKIEITGKDERVRLRREVV